MRFIINKERSGRDNNRVVIVKKQEPYTASWNGQTYFEDNTYYCNIVLKTTCDWKEDNDFAIVSDTDSIQYRPKGLFRNNKGIYYKNAQKKLTYLTDEEVKEMEVYITLAKQFLNE